MGTEFFRTTPAQLRQACRGWRDPLDQPVMREVVNALTGKTQTLPSWDPEFGKPTPEYALRDLPGTCIEMEGFEKLGVDSLIALVEGDNAEAVLAVRQRPPLIHPEEGPWLLEIPLSVVTKLAALDEELRPRFEAELRSQRTRSTANSASVTS